MGLALMSAAVRFIRLSEGSFTVAITPSFAAVSH
jgi:hypothetical protein